VLWAAVSAYVRSHVTPVADPRDGNGKPLMPSQAELTVKTVTGSTQVDFAQQIADEVARAIRPVVRPVAAVPPTRPPAKGAP
jgi:hypothetical protein